MAEWLILQLSRGLEERCGWMLADEHGQPLSAPRVGALAQAAGEAGGRRIAAIVPSSDVLMTEVELPQKSGVRPQQIAPFALEEQLAADIETLHFAVGPRDDHSGRTAVAVVTRSLMDQWLKALAAEGMTPAVICGEAALLPDNPGHTVLMIDGDTLSVRRAGQTPLAMPADDMAAALEAALGATLAEDHLLVYATPQDWHRHAPEAEALRSRCASLKVQLLNAGPLPLLAPQLAGGHYINLLVGDFGHKTSFGGDWRRWRLAAVLAAALVAVHIGGLSLELLQQQHSERALDEAIGNVARGAMPGDTGTGAVRSRIEQRLLAAQGQSGGSGLLAALAALAQAVSGVNGASVQGLSYREGGLDLKLKAADAASLERVDQALRNGGWQADLTSGAAAGSAYEGRIEMRPLGAVNPKRTR
ncbi:MAG TPA: type II secretion system protein GspL [Steroidobacteraceae bacterium]